VNPVRLGIDLDGVVSDFNEGWMSRYNAEYGTALTPDMVTTWDAMIPLTRFADVDEFWSWAEQGSDPRLFRNLPLFPGALASLQRLSLNHDIVIITTKPAWATSDTFAWIADNAIPTREVHITDEKWRVDCDVYLDDGPHNLASFARERPDRTTCRFVRPWNEAVSGTVDIVDWDSFETLVDQRWC
jgi:5'(3')-deoxyribonucleotidase